MAASSRGLYWWIGHRDWDRINEILNNDEAEQEKFRTDANYVSSIVTFAMNFDAPSEVVETMLLLNPQAILTPNGQVVIKLATTLSESLQRNLFVELTKQKQAVGEKHMNSKASSLESMTDESHEESATSDTRRPVNPSSPTQVLESAESPQSASSSEVAILPATLRESLIFADLSEQSNDGDMNNSFENFQMFSER